MPIKQVTPFRAKSGKLHEGLYLNALHPFDSMPSGRCDGCRRDTLCMVFEQPCGNVRSAHDMRLCVECLIGYARRLSKIARGFEEISDLV